MAFQRIAILACVTVLLTLPARVESAAEVRPPRKTVADFLSGLPGSREALLLESLAADLWSACVAYDTHYARQATSVEELVESGLLLLEPLDTNGIAIPMRTIAQGTTPPPGAIGFVFGENESQLIMMGAEGDPAKPMTRPFGSWKGNSDLGGGVPLDRRRGEQMIRSLSVRWGLFHEINGAHPTDVAHALNAMGWRPIGGAVLNPDEAAPEGQLSVLVEFDASLGRLQFNEFPELLAYPSITEITDRNQPYNPGRWSNLTRTPMTAFRNLSDPAAAFVPVGGVSVPLSAEQEALRRAVTAAERTELPDSEMLFYQVTTGRQAFAGQLANLQKLLNGKLPGQDLTVDLLQNTSCLLEIPRDESGQPIVAQVTQRADGLPPDTRAPGLYVGCKGPDIVVTIADKYRNLILIPGQRYVMSGNPIELTPAADARARYHSLLTAHSDEYPDLVNQAALEELLRTSDHWNDLRLRLFQNYFSDRVGGFVGANGRLPVTWDEYLEWAQLTPQDYEPLTGPASPPSGQMAVVLERDKTLRVMRMTIHPAIGAPASYYWVASQNYYYSSVSGSRISSSLGGIHELERPEVLNLEYEHLMSTLVPTDPE